MIRYPNRKSLLETKECEICNSNGATFRALNRLCYLGFWCCSSEDCINKIEQAIALITISNKHLIKEFGDKVCVVRNNGSKESNWTIVGDSYQEHKNGPFWINIKNNERKSKCITLDIMRLWNKNGPFCNEIVMKL